jgi:hypothetical protein
VDAKLEETIYRSSVLPSTVPCQCVITQLKLFIDHFAFADSMPHHARARPMRARTCTPPLLCRRHRHHRHLHWQYATTLQARRIDQFTLVNSLPCHVRARPMRARTCTPPLWYRRRFARQHSSPKLPQLRQGHRGGGGGMVTNPDARAGRMPMDGGDLVVPVSSSLPPASPFPLLVSLPRSLTPSSESEEDIIGVHNRAAQKRKR